CGIPAASIRVTTSRFKNRLTPCLFGIAYDGPSVRRLLFAKARSTSRVFGIHGGGLSKNSWRLTLFSSTNEIGHYILNHSTNHKQSATITQEVRDRSGIDPRVLVVFRPSMRDAREKLKWVASATIDAWRSRMRSGDCCRKLSQAQSGDITALDWVGIPSEFNSCLPADIISYKTLAAFHLVTSIRR
ncbi:hypothetical protein M405DRAFT_912294, partial [Rhizopogon salebrosus TDB-379]